jgi:hypothetical protein
MLFNYDSTPFFFTAVIVTGLFAYSFYNIFSTGITTYKEVGVQTDSIFRNLPAVDSISELPETTYPVLEPNILPDNLHLDTGVQTLNNSLWSLFKDWLLEKYSIISGSIVRTPTEVRVGIDKLDSTQVVSSPSMNSVVSNKIYDLPVISSQSSLSPISNSNLQSFQKLFICVTNVSLVNIVSFNLYVLCLIIDCNFIC